MPLRKPELGTPQGRPCLALLLYDSERRLPPADADEAAWAVVDGGDPLIVGQLCANHPQRPPEQGPSTGTCPVREDWQTGLLPITSHWGRGPMEMGVYMLGTFQALAESSSNVLTRYISFTFQMYLVRTLEELSAKACNVPNM